MKVFNSLMQLFIPRLRETLKWVIDLHFKAPSMTYVRPVFFSSVMLAETLTF